MSEPLKGYRYSFHVSSVVQHLFALVFGRSFRLASGIFKDVISHNFPFFPVLCRGQYTKQQVGPPLPVLETDLTDHLAMVSAATTQSVKNCMMYAEAGYR
jgi:hypothetical protein